MTNEHRDQFDYDIDREAAYEALEKWAGGGMCLREEDRVVDKKTGRVYTVYFNIGCNADTGYVVIRRDPNDEPRLLAASSGVAPSSYLADIKRDMKCRRCDFKEAK